MRLACIGLAALLLPAASPAFEYTVTVPENNPSLVHVEGRFLLEGDAIGMYITNSPQLEGGQADLVRNLAIAHENGTKIEYTYEGAGDWRVVGAQPGTAVTVAYDVALEHAQYSWGPGIEEVAYKQNDGLFFTGFSLFLFPGLDSSEPVTVRFDLPSGWRASTPWIVAEGDLPTFRAPSAYALGRNCLFLGTHFEETITRGDFTFILAVGGGLEEHKDLFIESMEALPARYQEIFGGMPRASRYLAVINPGDRSDGGAFNDSYSMQIRGPVNRASRAVWGHGIAHEVLHFWNGHSIVPAGSDEEWFREGFTDYLTITELARLGLDSREITFRKLENTARRYAIARLLMGSQESMRAAGAEKHKNRMLVYGGGTLVAFALDVSIREATGNERGLPDFMRAMYREFSGDGKEYTFDDIVRIAGEVSGRSQADFFSRYVDGTEYLDIGPSIDAIGLQLTTMVDEFYIAPREDATSARRAIADAMFGPPPVAMQGASGRQG